MSKKLKLTPWFPIDVKPVRVGIYQRNYGSEDQEDIVYSRWDGLQFFTYGSTPEQAASYGRKPSGIWNRTPWRGLAVKP